MIPQTYTRSKTIKPLKELVTQTLQTQPYAQKWHKTLLYQALALALGPHSMQIADLFTKKKKLYLKLKSPLLRYELHPQRTVLLQKINLYLHKHKHPQATLESLLLLS